MNDATVQKNYSINVRLDTLIKEARLTNALLAALLKPVTVIAWCCLETQLRLSVAADQAVHLLHQILAQLTVLSNTVRSLQQIHESSQRVQLAQQISHRGDVLMGLVLLYTATKAYFKNFTRQCQKHGSCLLQGLFLGEEICQWMGISSAPAPRQWLCELRRASLFLLGFAITGCWAAYAAYQLLREQQSVRVGLSGSSRTSSCSSSGSLISTCSPSTTKTPVQLQPLHPINPSTWGTRRVSQHSQDIQDTTLQCRQAPYAQSDQPRHAESTPHPSTASSDASLLHGFNARLAPACLASALEFAAQVLSTALLAHLSLYVPVHCAAVALMGGSWRAWLLLHCVRFTCMQGFASSAHPGTVALQPLPIFFAFCGSCRARWMSNLRQVTTEKRAALQSWQRNSQEQQMYGSQAEECVNSAPGLAAAHSLSAQSIVLLLLQMGLPVAHGVLPFALEMLVGYGVQTCLCIAVLLLTHYCWQQVHKLIREPSTCAEQIEVK